MLIRGLSLEGSMKGLRYFFIPKWEDLLKPSVRKIPILLKNY